MSGLSCKIKFDCLTRRVQLYLIMSSVADRQWLVIIEFRIDDKMHASNTHSDYSNSDFVSFAA